MCVHDLQDVILALRAGNAISSIMESRESPQSSVTTVMAASSSLCVKMEDEAMMMRYAPMLAGEPPCVPKRSLDIVSSQQLDGSVAEPSSLSQQTLYIEGNQQLLKARKLWLHTAVEPAPGGSGSQICRYCGTILSSINVSVRKKVHGIDYCMACTLSWCCKFLIALLAHAPCCQQIMHY